MGWRSSRWKNLSRMVRAALLWKRSTSPWRRCIPKTYRRMCAGATIQKLSRRNICLAKRLSADTVARCWSVIPAVVTRVISTATTGAKEKGLNHSPAIRAEALEETVALAIKKQFLQDNVIRKLAKETIKYQKEVFEQESNCTELRHQLADVQNRRKNVFKAIESGFVSESLQKRLHELDGQEKSCSAWLLPNSLNIT